MKKFRRLHGTHATILTEHCLDEMQEAGLEPKNGSSFATAQISLANVGDIKVADFARNLTSWSVGFAGKKSVVIDVPPSLKALHKRGDIQVSESVPGWVCGYTVETQEALNLMVETLKAL